MKKHLALLLALLIGSIAGAVSIEEAIENQAFVAGVNRVGIDDSNIEYKGESMILNVKGRVVEQAQPGECVFTAELSECELEAFREYFRVAKDWD